MARKRLGEILIERGIINEAQLRSGLAYQRYWGHRLGAALVAKGYLTEAVLCEVLGDALALPVVDLAKVVPENEALELLAGRFCETHALVPLSIERTKGRGKLTCAMGDPLNVPAMDEIEFTTSMKVRPVLAPLSQVQAAIRRYYFGVNVEVPSFHDLPADRSNQAAGGMDLVGQDDPSRLPPQPEFAQAPFTPPPLPPAAPPPTPTPRAATDLSALEGGPPAAMAPAPSQTLGVDVPLDAERMEQLERNFWGLMRVLARKGVVNREEFIAAVREAEQASAKD